MLACTNLNFSLTMIGFSILLFVGTMALSLWASWRVKHIYQKHLNTPSGAGVSGAQAASEILRAANIHDVEIVEHEGMLGDHYDPIHKRLVLSHQNFRGGSAAALGVAAHECGHAIQHKALYAPLQWRMAAVGATTFASQIVMWLPLIGLFTGLVNMKAALLIMAVAWGVIMIFNLITLPVEFDASRRAVAILDGMGFVRSGSENQAVREVLNAAAFTYVAAFITSLAYFLWHLLPLILGRRE